RVGLRVNNEGGEYVAFDQAGSVVLTKVAMLDISGLYFYPRLKLSLSADNSTLFLTQSTKTNTSTLVALTLQDKKIINLGNDPEADICDVLMDPRDSTPLAFATNYTRKKWWGIKPEINNDLQFLQSQDNGDIDIVSQTNDNQQWLICYLH